MQTHHLPNNVGLSKLQRIQRFIIVSPYENGHSLGSYLASSNLQTLSSNRLLLQSLRSRAVAFHTFTRTCSGRGDEMFMSHPNTMNNHNKSPPTIMNFLGTPTSHGMPPPKKHPNHERPFWNWQTYGPLGIPHLSILRNQHFRPQQQVDPLPWVKMSTFLLVGIHGYPYYGFSFW